MIRSIHRNRATAPEDELGVISFVGPVSGQRPTWPTERLLCILHLSLSVPIHYATVRLGAGIGGIGRLAGRGKNTNHQPSTLAREARARTPWAVPQSWCRWSQLLVSGRCRWPRPSSFPFQPHQVRSIAKIGTLRARWSCLHIHRRGQQQALIPSPEPPRWLVKDECKSLSFKSSLFTFFRLRLFLIFLPLVGSNYDGRMLCWTSCIWFRFIGWLQCPPCPSPPQLRHCLRSPQCHSCAGWYGLRVYRRVI